MEADSHDLRTQTPEDKSQEIKQYWHRWNNSTKPRSPTPEDRKPADKAVGAIYNQNH
ncbi:hypothetical protein DPMN_076139 [Dreissena polymorpha]|uniref:Uncharacterized protein n=1 Tax=Dreissena polymorpha TaxID=45954 RepID=A0A9D3YMI6_DREPO|nr:hypothetical protein DPMN_076139 [Dreissena polymorpha]